MNIKEVAMGIATGFLMMSTGLFLGGCGNRSKLDSADVEGFDTIVLYVNSVKGHKEDSTIVGYFVKGKLDTLFFRSIPPWEEEMENGENNYHSVVYSSNPDIPRFDIYNNIYPCFVNEGDLDGNGTTDFGILDTWNSSSCRMYRVYTLYKNRWVYLIPPIKTAENLRGSGLELVESASKNQIKIRYSDFNAPLSSCASAPIRDTIISPTFETIED